MANASYVQDSFAGGEKSQLAQGRITDREYRTWMNVCVNGHPTEAGGCVRRSGTMFAGTTRGGRNGRVVKFDFAAATPYTIEFTDGFLRFRRGTQFAFTADAEILVAISAANPAVVQTPNQTGWVTGNTVMFAPNDPTSGVPILLQNRQFIITVVDPTHFSLRDALTGANIDGSTLSPVIGSVVVGRVEELSSPYVGGAWATVRVVQAETTAVMLQGIIPPQLLSLLALPTMVSTAQFNLAPITFLDGPYLDPFTNGVQAVPGSKSGNVTLTLQFPAWSATQAYKVGDFVTSGGVNYISLVDNNVNSSPPSANWSATSAGAAINNGQGFLGSDIGRLVRLFSEPPLWVAATTYAVGNIVAYNPSGAAGASVYWTSLVGANTGNIPGTDVTHWQLTTNAALWSWGKITSLANEISRSLAGSVNIGDMTGNGGLAAAFDGVINQVSASCAARSFGFIVTGVTSFVGKNYSGASAQQIGSATIWPSSDFGWISVPSSSFGQPRGGGTVVINLRAKASAPANSSDGTLLGSSGSVDAGVVTAITIMSNDQVTAWNYVWFEIVFTPSFPQTLTLCAAEVKLFNPTGTGSGTAINIELLGPPLLYTSAIITWRLGAYSTTTGWPTCGTYHEGRIWLGGAIGNRFDASVSNGLVGTTLNMAPTDQNGTVGAANAVTGVVNSDGVNPIFWFTPDLQGIIMGTQAGEWLISAPSPGAISPTNISARRVTRIGCANVEPRKTDHTNVFVQRYTRKCMEYFTDVYSGKFAAPNLAKDTLHITKPGIAELAYTSAVVPIVWGRNADGSWWGTTYKRDTLATSQGPTINGWHRHSLGSGRSVQSICAGPSVGGNLDALTMVTLDAVTGIYHVEVMTDTVDEGNTLIQATYLDDAVNPTSTSTSNVTPAPYGGLTLNGLWHLNGKKVTAWLGGLDCGDYTVSNGSILVPYGDGISAGTATGLFTATFAASLSLSQMLIGFTFTSQGQLVRPATPQESGARNGPAVGKKRRNHKFATQLEGTGIGLSFGTTFAKVDPARFRQPNDTALLLNQQFTGVHKDTLTDDNSYDGMLCWQQTRPQPANFANIAGFIETVDE